MPPLLNYSPIDVSSREKGGKRKKGKRKKKYGERKRRGHAILFDVSASSFLERRGKESKKKKEKKRPLPAVYSSLPFPVRTGRGGGEKREGKKALKKRERTARAYESPMGKGERELGEKRAASFR